ncbi:MAG: ATP-binding cassette domain-containing protein [Pedosphaera sp.]|nr:ATP-binding cassette domain-containing protein [Pedosphaera sp.]
MIESRSISKSFGRQNVLDGVSFTIEAGQSVVILGRSGSGKSVLLKHLVGLMSPDSGEVFVGGQRLNGMTERSLLQVRRKFGMLFQGAALFDSLSVGDNIAFAMRREGRLTATEIDRRTSEMLELVDLPGIQHKKPSELSGGMKKRVGLARAIAHKPEVLLYDEPTTGLDPIGSDSIDQLMERVCEQFKVTSIIVTHDMRTARRLGRRILLLRDGRIYADRSAGDFFSSKDPFVHRFVNGIADSKEMELL